MQLLTAEELAAVLRTSPETVRRLSREKKIPHIQLGEAGGYRYDRGAVLAALSPAPQPSGIADTILDLIQAGIARDPWLAWNSVNDAFDDLRKTAPNGSPLAALLAELADKAFARASLPAPERRAPATVGVIDEAGVVESAETWGYAPWPDFGGTPIIHGSVLTHPDGSRFVAVRALGVSDPADAWRAVYPDRGPSLRLCLQIGDRGQARVVAE